MRKITALRYGKKKKFVSRERICNLSSKTQEPMFFDEKKSVEHTILNVPI